MQTVTPLLITGLIIGLVIAIIGGAIDYLLGNRVSNPRQTRQLPGCMLYIAGALGFVGLIALFISFILEGSIGPAIILGAGILGGFYAGFAVLMFLYLLVNHYWPGMGD